jgi:hypothetical protein
MPPVGFEPTVSAGERPQTNALDLWVLSVGFAQCHPSGAYSLEVVLIYGKFLDPWPNATRNLFFGLRLLVNIFGFIQCAL